MPTDTPGAFHIDEDLREITSFRFSHIADCSLGLIPGISNALRQMRRTTMPSQEENPETPTQQDVPVTTSKETNLGRLANEAARRATKRQQHYDQEQGIFTK
jgi:hypothetical protein